MWKNDEHQKGKSKAKTKCKVHLMMSNVIIIIKLIMTILKSIPNYLKEKENKENSYDDKKRNVVSNLAILEQSCENPFGKRRQKKTRHVCLICKRRKKEKFCEKNLWLQTFINLVKRNDLQFLRKS